MKKIGYLETQPKEVIPAVLAGHGTPPALNAPCVCQDLPLSEAFPVWGCIILKKFPYDEFPKGILYNTQWQSCKFTHFVSHLVALRFAAFGGEKRVVFWKHQHVQTRLNIKGPSQTFTQSSNCHSSSDVPRPKSWLVTGCRRWTGRAGGGSRLYWASQRSPTPWPQSSGLTVRVLRCHRRLSV